MEDLCNLAVDYIVAVDIPVAGYTVAVDYIVAGDIPAADCIVGFDPIVAGWDPDNYSPEVVPGPMKKESRSCNNSFDRTGPVLHNRDNYIIAASNFLFFPDPMPLNLP